MRKCKNRHIRLGGGKIATDLRVLCNDLQQLGEQKPTPEARAALNAALYSKWEGVRIVALRALRKWNDEESIRTLRVLLEELVPDNKHSRIVDFLVGALYHNIKHNDMEAFEWLVDLFIYKAHAKNRRRPLSSLFTRFRPRNVRARMALEREKVKGDEELISDIDYVISIQWY